MFAINDDSNDAIGGFSEYMGKCISLNTSELTDAVSIIADEAGKIAHRAASRYANVTKGFDGSESPHEQAQIVFHLTNAIQYSRLAGEMAYIRETRIPLLPVSTNFEIYIDEVGYDSFRNLISGRPYSLDNLAYSQQWYENITEAIDPSIPNARIHKAATAFYKGSRLAVALWRQPDDVLTKNAAVAILKTSAFGADLLEQVESFACSQRFIDLRFLNIVREDCRKGSAAAFYDDNGICVDISNQNSTVYRAIKLAHECGHTLQHRIHLKTRVVYSENQRNADKYFTGFQNNLNQFSSTLEAHSIGCEYIVASELLAAGVNPEKIRTALHYSFSPDLVNLISSDPAAFILEVSQSTDVRKKWGFKPEQTRASQKLATAFATSMRPLCGTWVDLPEPPPRNTLDEDPLFIFVGKPRKVVRPQGSNPNI